MKSEQNINSMINPTIADMSESERWEYLAQLIKQGKGPKKGRPRKDGSTVTWGDFGLTRTEVFKNKQLAQVSQAAMDVYIAQRRAKGRTVSTRGILVAGGVIENVSDENIFVGSGIYEEAKDLLRAAEHWLKITHRPAYQKKWMIRAMIVELRKMRYAIKEQDEQEL